MQSRPFGSTIASADQDKVVLSADMSRTKNTSYHFPSNNIIRNPSVGFTSLRFLSIRKVVRARQVFGGCRSRLALHIVLQFCCLCCAQFPLALRDARFLLLQLSYDCAMIVFGHGAWRIALLCDWVCLFCSVAGIEGAAMFLHGCAWLCSRGCASVLCGSCVMVCVLNIALHGCGISLLVVLLLPPWCNQGGLCVFAGDMGLAWTGVEFHLLMVTACVCRILRDCLISKVHTATPPAWAVSASLLLGRTQENGDLLARQLWLMTG